MHNKHNKQTLDKTNKMTNEQTKHKNENRTQTTTNKNKHKQYMNIENIK